MDAGRFVELYASEAREHLALLSRSVLTLESPAGAEDAVGEAFRAAHTLKGVAAAMGHDRVTELAHAIEDRLEELRSGRARVVPEMVDSLLASVDSLVEAVEISIRAPGPVTKAANANVRLDPETPLKGARATLIAMNLRKRGLITETVPATFGDDFDGEFTVVPAPDTDREVLETAVLASGDVESIQWTDTRPDDSAATQRSGPQIKVDPRRLDTLAEGISELTVLHARLATPEAQRSAGDRTAMILAELHEEVLRLRMLPVAIVFDRLPRAVRDAARASGKSVRLTLEGGDIELDRAMLDELGDLLLHLVRNAVDHGIEPPDMRTAAGKAEQGELVVSAERERTSVRITVREDGRGIPRARIAEHAARLGLIGQANPDALTDDDILRVLTQAGFSTAERVTELSGRGVGLDAVAARLRTLGGALLLRTEEGRGTTFTMRLPLTLALAHALRVRVAGEDYAIPLTHVAEAVEIQDVLVSAVAGRETVRVRDDILPLIRLRQVLGLPQAGTESAAVVAEIGARRAALAVDELVGREQILIKSFDSARGALPYFSGATLLANGRPALVLDPLSVV
jgi:two-component system chemotaxis sensor kinase CheA